MKKINYFILISMIIASSMLFFSSCEEVADNPDNPSDTNSVVNSLLGWLQGSENTDELESDINLGATTGSGSLPASVDLSAKFPPIGNQGQYGTCVAWACGYNLRSFLYKVDHPDANLSVTSNQFSPKDLFWAIPNSEKGSSCNGTQFEAALDVMVSRGIATMATVPYTSLGGCSSSPESGWTSNANQYKLLNYRKIQDFKNANVLKQYLSEGKAVVFGAKLGDRFMEWNDGSIINYDTYNNPGMQHAYHAMILCGYDNSKGANGAFRVVNSWGTNWGDNGYIWVDERFFTCKDNKEFVFCAFVGNTPQTDPDPDDNNNVDPNNITTGNDLIAWELSDNQNTNFASEPRKRSINYNVFNAGSNTISASSKWSIVYMAYNAYDANDYKILIYDYYTNEYGTPGDENLNNGSFSTWSGAPTALGLSANWWNNVDVPSGQSVAQALYCQTGTADTRFNFNYTMPESINGKYYLVLVADAFDVIPNETNENNNYYFLTSANGEPIDIVNGVIQNLAPAKSIFGKVIAPVKNQKTPAQTLVSKKNVNTYRPYEIKRMIKTQMQNGELQKRVNQYLKTRNKDDKKEKYTLK